MNEWSQLKKIIKNVKTYFLFSTSFQQAVIAQLGERQTEDLKVPGSIPGRGIFLFLFSNFFI